MTRFNDIKDKPSKKFVRNVGISLDMFLHILEKVEKYIEIEKQKNPLKRRGRKSKKNFILSDKLLLFFYYIRHYPTFDRLGQEFGICESYAYKIYQQMFTILLKVLDMPNPKKLLDTEIETIIIDVTEQAIERPKKKQKKYYSGKKTAYYKSSTYY